MKAARRRTGRVRFVLAQIRHDRARTITTLLAIAVATAAFTVLTGAADTGRVEAKHAVAASGHSAYDVLVRPRDSQTAIERSSDQVRSGFLDGVYGGISLDQYHQIERLPGVSIAAPVAMVGYTLQIVFYPVDLTHAVTRAQRQLLSLTLTTTTDRGLSHIALPPSYVYVTRRPLKRPPSSGSVEEITAPTRERQRDGTLTPVCGNGDRYPDAFVAQARNFDACLSLADHKPLSTPVVVSVPLLIEAIDPRAEARLDGLDHTIVGGRYLRENDSGDTSTGTEADANAPTFPVLVSSRNYLDDTVDIAVRRLSQRAADAVRARRLGAADNAQRGSGPVVARMRIPIGAAYQHLVKQLRGLVDRSVFSPLDGVWRTVPAGYQAIGRGGTLQPTTTTNPASTWRSTFQFTGYVATPADNDDQAFRTVTPKRTGDLGQESLPAPFAVGEFDPARVAPFNRLTHVPLGGYEPPQATPADARSSALRGGRSLAPNSNLGGYLNQPPQLITTLASLPTIAGGFPGQFDTERPISAIRVRVAGAAGLDALSRARVNLVAQNILEKTGLQVDITAGSSPSTRVTALPPGRYGRPALMLREGWIDKGVALRILRAVDRKSLVLFVLVLLVCSLFVLNATTAAVRARRQQLGLLACVGWSPRQLFGNVLREQALLGVVAGVVGAAVAIPVAHAAGLHVTTGRVVIGIAAATLLAVLAGLVPATAAARTVPLAALRPAVSRFRSRSAVRSRHGMALRNLLRTRGRSLIAIAGLGFGVCSSVLLLAVTTSFRGQLAGNLLGEAVTIRVRGVDYAAVVVMLAIGFFGIADVLYLNVRERANELATLQAGGWSRRDVTTLIVVEGGALGLLGSLAGTAAGVALIANFTSESLGSAIELALVALVIGTALGALAAAVPVGTLPRRLAGALAEE